MLVGQRGELDAARVERRLAHGSIFARPAARPPGSAALAELAVPHNEIGGERDTRTYEVNARVGG